MLNLTQTPTLIQNQTPREIPIQMKIQIRTQNQRRIRHLVRRRCRRLVRCRRLHRLHPARLQHSIARTAEAIKGYSDDDDGADQNFLHVVRHTHEGATVGENRHKKRAHDRSSDAA